MLSQKVLDGEITLQVAERVYSNQGNPFLIDLLGIVCSTLVAVQAITRLWSNPGTRNAMSLALPIRL